MKLVDDTILDSDLTDIANAIRRKTGETATLEFPDEFIEEIGKLHLSTMVIDNAVVSDHILAFLGSDIPVVDNKEY